MEKMASKITKNFYSYSSCSWLLNVVYYWPQCCMAYVTKHEGKSKNMLFVDFVCIIKTARETDVLAKWPSC